MKGWCGAVPSRSCGAVPNREDPQALSNSGPSQGSGLADAVAGSGVGPFRCSASPKSRGRILPR